MIELASQRLPFGRLTPGKPGRDAAEQDANVLISSRACRASRVFDVGGLGNLRYDWYSKRIVEFHSCSELHSETSIGENTPFIQIVPLSASPRGCNALGTRRNIEMLGDENPAATNFDPANIFSAR
jgi:hypothetical protein